MTNRGLVLRYAVGSDHGLHRTLNEDSAYASARLLAVADGMGGHAHGEVASSLAIAAISELDHPAELTDPLAALSEAIRDAVHRLQEATEADSSMKGMGTTLTALLWDGVQLYVAHLGDSRAYRVREDTLTQITHDHTLVQSLVDEGRLSAEQAQQFPLRSMLVRALQSSGSGEPDLFSCDPQPQDRYLLCSDGLTEVVDPEAIQHVLTSTTDREQAVRQLIDLANEAGGPDNITCVIADLVEAEPQEGVVVAGAAQEAS